MFLDCEQKYGELTCKILRYVNEGIHPTAPCEEEPELQPVHVERNPKRFSNKFNVLAFLFDLFTLGFLHGYFQK